MRVLELDGATVNIDNIERYFYLAEIEAVVVIFVSGTKVITEYTSLESFEAALKASREI